MNIRCLECQKWMTQEEKLKKNYCSSQCRSKAYDRRKKLEDSEELKTFIKSFKVSEKTIETAKKEMQKNSNLSGIEIICKVIAPSIQNKDLLQNILENFFKNKFINVLIENISDHLGIEVDLLLEIVKEFFSKVGLMINMIFSDSYWDWDIHYNNR